MKPSRNLHPRSIGKLEGIELYNFCLYVGNGGKRPYPLFKGHPDHPATIEYLKKKGLSYDEAN